ncbi:MAG TPA: DapH/DapD/GlmU-related protein [Bdellovibrionota bacterium]|nr:DapH/DapD/GlmU-related protein [Bdellovibrionota bacterium]
MMIFYAIMGICAFLALWVAVLSYRAFPFPEFRAILSVSVAAVFYLVFMWIAHRAWIFFFPLKEGEIPAGSFQETTWMVYVCFYLMLFYAILMPHWIPIPMSGWVLRRLGSKWPVGSYSGGMVYDPSLVEAGVGVLVGAHAMLVPHVQEGETLAHYRIRIGDEVTIGGRAIILPGVTIGARSVIGIGSVVPKHTRIGEDEIWAGIPARFIRKRDQKTSS